MINIFRLTMQPKIDDIMDEFIEAYITLNPTKSHTSFGELIPPEISDIPQAYRKAMVNALVEECEDDSIVEFLFYSKEFTQLMRKSLGGIAGVEYKDVINKAVEEYYFKHSKYIIDRLIEKAVDRYHERKSWGKDDN